MQTNAIYFPPQDHGPPPELVSAVEETILSRPREAKGRTPTATGGNRKAVLFRDDLWEKILIMHGRSGQTIGEIVNTLVAVGLEALY